MAALPSGVRGPVDFCAFRRLASIWAWVAIDGVLLWRRGRPRDWFPRLFCRGWNARRVRRSNSCFGYSRRAGENVPGCLYVAVGTGNMSCDWSFGGRLDREAAIQDRAL